MQNRIGDVFLEQPAALIQLSKTKEFLLTQLIPAEEQKYGKTSLYYKCLFMCDAIDIEYAKVEKITGKINMSAVDDLIADYIEAKCKECGICIDEDSR